MNIQKSRLAAILSIALVLCMIVSLLALPVSAVEIGDEVYLTFEEGSSRVYYLVGAILKSYGAEQPVNESWARIASYFVDTEWCVYFYYNEDTEEVFIERNMFLTIKELFVAEFPDVAPPELPETYYITSDHDELFPLNYPDWKECPNLGGYSTFIVQTYPEETEPEETEPEVTEPEETEPEETEPEETEPEETEPEETTPVTPPIDVSPDGGAFGTVTVSMLSRVMDEIKGLLPVAIPAMLGYIGLRKSLAFLFEMLRRA